MRRLHVFLIVFGIALAVLLTLAFVSLYLATAAPSYYGSSWMSQMWGMGSNNGNNYGGMNGMMGNGTGTTSSSSLWIIPVALISVSVVAIIGVGFYLAFPELRYIRGKPCAPSNVGLISVPSATAVQPETESPAVSTVASVPNAQTAPPVSSVSNSCDVLLKTMTPEEQRVLNVLIGHQGKYLQKYVVKEAGLTRLKTHRIVARFAERGIVTVREFGNTNEVVLSDWVKGSNIPRTAAL